MARVSIEYIGGGQYTVTDGTNHHNLTLDMGIVADVQNFGMRPRHRALCPDRSGTDGTVRCDACGQTVDAFYNQARRYLDSLADTGRTVTDPGYFWEC